MVLVMLVDGMTPAMIHLLGGINSPMLWGGAFRIGAGIGLTLLAGAFIILRIPGTAP